MYDLEWKFDDDHAEKTIAFYTELLDQDFVDSDEKEFYIRTQIWWSINNLIRHLSCWRSARNLRQLNAIIRHRREDKALFRSFTTLFDENMERLIFLFIKGADVDLLYLANMYRESGNFSKAREILDKVEQKSGTWRKVKRKVRRKDRIVFRHK